jgi:hypothetical protein
LLRSQIVSTNKAREEDHNADQGPKATKSAKAATKRAKAKTLGAIDAPAPLLAMTSEPMGTRQTIETLAAKGLWTKSRRRDATGDAYSAILRESHSQRRRHPIHQDRMVEVHHQGGLIRTFKVSVGIASARRSTL